MREPKHYRIPWSGRSVIYSNAEIRAVVKAMQKADPLTQGKYQKEFEEKFSEYTKTKHSFAVSNCTAALELSAILSKIGKGDEIIIPGHTFCATAIPFARTGAKIVWADIDPETRVVSADTISKCITPRTKVIVVVHLYGLMAEMDSIMKLAKRNNLYVVEDCAQALGAEHRGRKAGSFGDFGCFSFHCQKSITTLGEGGMLTVKSDALAKLVPGLRHNGSRPYPPGREKFWLPAMSNVDFDLDNVWPYNFCLNEAQCALGTESLKNLDAMNQKRRKRARKMIAALKDFPELSFQEIKESKMHVYHLLSAKYDGGKFGKTRDNFIETMVQKYKIKTIIQYYPLYRYPIFKKAGFEKANCPNTDDFFDNMVSFPFHYWMSDKDFQYMINSTKKTLIELRKQSNKML